MAEASNSREAEESRLAVRESVNNQKPLASVRVGAYAKRKTVRDPNGLPENTRN